jgi:eukaryotic-like serine/threonine-protein kinase
MKSWARGGMSAVYKAFDPNLKRVVAVKLIHPHLASDPKFLVRFEEEAAAVAQLRHPNIVKVFDFDHDGDLYYMVQEFVPGETLQERLRRLNREGRRLSLKETIQITAEMCDATGYAHELGMIHRDIKPANIMLNDEGQAVLMDFGIVKITSSQQHTATGAVVGTALYLPPEIIRGEAADPRSDIYSLGVTLYEMVSGRPPFEANSAMTLLMMHLHDPVPDLRKLRPEVPNKFIAVIEKALAKDRSDRYRSMGEMAVALRRLGMCSQLPRLRMRPWLTSRGARNRTL